MPSEKSRYLKENLGPSAPLRIDELRDHLPALGANHLAEILWVRSQGDDVLRKALMASVGIELADGDTDKAKEAINYALHFPDYVRYTEGGHGQVLDEIKTTLETLWLNGKKEFSIQIAEYAVDRGQAIAENFEDDWDWTSSLEDLKKWIERVKR